MATTYQAIASNKRRSLFLILVFIVIIGLAGWAFSQWLDVGNIGIVFAVLLAVGMSLGGYYGGDKVALAASGARGPITQDDNPYLYRLVENLCIANGQPLPKIYLMEDPAINAFATGRDPQRASIAVTTGAIEKLENEELEGVLAHELSHIKNFDIRFMTLVTVLAGVLILLADFFWRAQWFGGRRSGNRSNNQAQGILMIIGLVLLILAPIIGRLIQFAVSRRREFLADASGALLTRYPEGLASALQKIETGNRQPMAHASNATAHLFFSNPFGPVTKGLSRLFMTHPPIPERVAALRAMGNIR